VLVSIDADLLVDFPRGEQPRVRTECKAENGRLGILGAGGLRQVVGVGGGDLEQQQKGEHGVLLLSNLFFCEKEGPEEQAYFGAEETALATRSEATLRGMRRDRSRGKRRQDDADRVGRRSAHTSVPVEPVWPNVFSEQPGLPERLPTANPNPRGARPSGLWFLHQEPRRVGLQARRTGIVSPPSRRTSDDPSNVPASRGPGSASPRPATRRDRDRRGSSRFPGLIEDPLDVRPREDGLAAETDDAIAFTNAGFLGGAVAVDAADVARSLVDSMIPTR